MEDEPLTPVSSGSIGNSLEMLATDSIENESKNLGSTTGLIENETDDPESSIESNESTSLPNDPIELIDPPQKAQASDSKYHRGVLYGSGSGGGIECRRILFCNLSAGLYGQRRDCTG